MYLTKKDRIPGLSTRQTQIKTENGENPCQVLKLSSEEKIIPDVTLMPAMNDLEKKTVVIKRENPERRGI